MERVKQENINTVEHWDTEHAKRDEEVSMRFAMVAELIRRSGGKKVLDIGCGLGELYKELEHQGYHTIFHGVDFSRSAIDRCEEMYGSQEWVVAEIGNIPFDDKHFDVVVSCEVLEHVEDPHALVEDMKRLVKDNGTIVLTTPLENKIYSEEHVWSFDEDDIRDLFKGYKVQFARPFPTLIIANITK